MARSVVCTPGQCSGSPRIAGTGLTCAAVAAGLFEPRGVDGVLASADGLSVEDILACMQYCADQQCLRDNTEHFCEGCMLDDRIDISGGGDNNIGGRVMFRIELKNFFFVKIGHRVTGA